MAIQVNGTEVISNSRALNNIASVDATTATAIGNAGVGGLSTTTTTSALAFSHTGGNPIDLSDNGAFSTSPPSSSIVYASKTISSGVALASITVLTASSGITVYETSYYGVTVGVIHWDGSNLHMLGRGYFESALTSSASTAQSYIQGKSVSSGIISVKPGDILYGVIMSSYDNGNFTGGASWSAGTVTTTFLEVA